MADFVLRKIDRWEEIEGLEALISSGRLRIQWLWEKAAQGDTEGIQSLLDELEILPDGFWNRVAGLRLIALPDDIRGTVHRLWLRRKPDPHDWSPRKK
jgi:hypothetical protein